MHRFALILTLGLFSLASVATLNALAQTPADPPAAEKKAEPPAVAPADMQPAPAAGTPAAGTPAAGTPAAGTPAAAPTPAGTPAGAPASGAPMPVEPATPPTGERKPSTGTTTGKPMPRTTDALQQQCWDAIGNDEQFRHDLKLFLAERLLQDPKSKLDFELRARIDDMLRPAIHTKDADRMLRNKQHVVMAYAALWVLTALFVLFMWIKQRSFAEQIERLKRELQEAM